MRNWRRSPFGVRRIVNGTLGVAVLLMAWAAENVVSDLLWLLLGLCIVTTCAYLIHERAGSAPR